MAANSSLVLLLDHATWQLARLTAKGVETMPPVELDWVRTEAMASDVKTAIDTWKVRRRRIVIALQGNLCVSALFPLPSQRQARQRQAMAYLLEPHLPWPAEEFVADYEIDKADSFAVAIPLEPISGLIRKLEDNGISIESVAPLARLALQRELKQLASGASRFVLLWGADSSIDLWLVDKKRPVLWRNIDLDPATVERELKQIAFEERRQLPLVAVGLNEAVSEPLTRIPEFTVRTIANLSPMFKLEAAMRAAGGILAGSEMSPIELRRDGLSHRNPNRSINLGLRALQLSFLCLLVAVAVTLYQFGEQLDQQRRVAGDRQTELFRKLFPESPVPVGVRTRLESEHAKLTGMRGEIVEIPDNLSAVALIERLLRSLPADMRFRILEVRVESGRLYLVGQVREHADADRIAEGLRKLDLTVESPSTHRLPQKGVEFRISSQLPPPPPVSKEANS